MLEQSHQKHPDNVAFLSKPVKVSLTFRSIQEYYADVEAVGTALGRASDLTAA